MLKTGKNAAKKNNAPNGRLITTKGKQGGKAMLILSRFEGQSIFIRTPNGDKIEVVVSFVQGKKVRVGVNAPKNHAIYRKELAHKFETPQQENS